MPQYQFRGPARFELPSLLDAGAEEDSSERETQNGESFRKIGAGACGAVFGQDGKSVVYKLAKTDDEQPLWNDYGMHTLIAGQFRKWGFNQVKVPECYYFVPRGDPHYFNGNKNTNLVEAAKQVCHLPTSVLTTERIFPLPKRTRDLLIEKYCAPQIREAAFGDVANKDCLVRVYLGSMQGTSGRRFFSLRNFKMHLNQMLELQLDVKEMAGRIGIAMAIMHWAAKTDACDVEFVLGSSWTKTFVPLSGPEVQDLPYPTYTGPTSHICDDFSSRTTGLWLLDFNQVRRISLDEAGVAQAVEAAIINDPYIPKPLQESDAERLVWNAFARQYLRASDTILAEEGDQTLWMLPRMFIHGLISWQKERQRRQE